MFAKLFLGGESLVKIIASDGKEEKFDSKDVEKDLKVAGLPEKVAEEVAERVEDKVQDGWTTAQVKQETDIELKRLQEDLNRATHSYMGTSSSMHKETTRRGESRVECRTVDADI
jgi:transcriptional regulator NrdR family protein